MRRREKSLAALMLALSMVVLPALPAQAGKSTSVVDTTTYENSLDESVWHNADGDILVEKGTIIFPDDSTESTKLMSKHVIEPKSQLDDMFSAEFTVKFTNLPEGEKFVFAFGMQSITAEPGQKGNVELAFFKENGIQKISVSAFLEDGSEKKLVQEVACGNGNVKVNARVTTEQKMKLTVGGRKVYDGTIPISGAGSLGFIQTGACGARINNFVYKCYTYDTPECPDFEEDFETGYYNKNVLSSKMQSGTDYLPSQMVVKDLNGNKVLMFENTGIAYITTQYEYSNFELTFDVPLYRSKPVYDENDEIISPQSDIMGITFGEDSTTSDYIMAADMFCLAGAGNGYRIPSGMPLDNGLRDETGTKAFCVRLSVIDGLVKLESKYKEDKAYTEIISYQLNETPTGYIKIWAPSGQPATFAIDNIKIVNKDVDAKRLDVEYESSKIIIPDDYAYTPLQLDYNPETVNGEEIADKGFDSVLLSVSLVCLLSIGITAVVTIVKTRKRKEGAIDEK